MPLDGGEFLERPDRRAIDPQVSDLRVTAARMEEKVNSLLLSVADIKVGQAQLIPRSEFNLELSNHTVAISKIADSVIDLVRGRVEPLERRTNTLWDLSQRTQGMVRLLVWGLGPGWLVTLGLAIYAFSHHS